MSEREAAEGSAQPQQIRDQASGLASAPLRDLAAELVADPDLTVSVITYQDGTHVANLGGLYPGGGAFSYAFQGEILSSVRINGVSNFYGSADCVVFGFKYAQPTTANVNALRRLYVGSPVEVPVAALTAGPQPDGLEDIALREDWAGQRKAYWASIA